MGQWGVREGWEVWWCFPLWSSCEHAGQPDCCQVHEGLSAASLSPAEPLLRRGASQACSHPRGTDKLQLERTVGGERQSGKFSQIAVILTTVQVLISYQKPETTVHQTDFVPCQSRVHLKQCAGTSTSGILSP